MNEWNFEPYLETPQPKWHHLSPPFFWPLLRCAANSCFARTNLIKLTIFEMGVEEMTPIRNRERPSLYYVSKRTGWVSSGNGIFFTDYCICAHIVDGSVWKSPKICWRSIGMFQDRPFVSPMSSLKRSHRKRAVPIKKTLLQLGTSYI